MAKRRKTPKGYDSTFEYNLHNGVLKNAKYHPCKLTYHREATYEPDFQITGSKIKIFVEAKGRFRTREEATKYIWIKKSLPKDTELVFVFEKANKPMPGARPRKDGTKQTMEEWATKNGFRYYEPHTIPKSWVRRKNG